MGIHGFMGRLVPFNGRKLVANTKGMTAVEAVIERHRIEATNKLYKDVRSSKINGVHILHIDFNTLCHMAVDPIYASGYYKDLMKTTKGVNVESLHENCYNLVLTLILELVVAVNPSEELTINVDGPVPVAKMWQQKQRRYESSLSLSKDSHFDKNAITPGSEWMRGLMKYLDSKFQTNEVKNKLPPRVVFSSDLVPGEGEHKILERIRSQQKNKKTVVYGQDSDLVLLCLLAIEEGHEAVIICDEFKSSTIGQYALEANVDFKLRNLKYDSFVNVGTLASAISSELINKPGSIKDFVFCCTLIGNDFVPRPFSMGNLTNGIDSIMNAIRVVKENVVDSNGNVSWYTFYLIIGEIVGEQGFSEILLCYKIEINKYLEQTGDWYIPEENAEPEEYEDLYNKFIKLQSLWYTNALCPVVESKYSMTFADIAEMSVCFLQAVSWTYQYYFHGHNKVSWDWYYPYHYSPFLVDVHQALSVIIDNKYTSHIVPLTIQKTNCLEQMIAVMPHYSLRWIPEIIWFFWTEMSPVADAMPQGIVIDKDGLSADETIEETSEMFGVSYETRKLVSASKDWTGVKVLPTIPMNRIRKALLHLKGEDLSKFQDEERVYTRRVFVEPLRSTRGRGGTRRRM